MAASVGQMSCEPVFPFVFLVLLSEFCLMQLPLRWLRESTQVRQKSLRVSGFISLHPESFPMGNNPPSSPRRRGVPCSPRLPATLSALRCGGRARSQQAAGLTKLPPAFRSQNTGSEMCRKGRETECQLPTGSLDHKEHIWKRNLLPSSL